MGDSLYAMAMWYGTGGNTEEIKKRQTSEDRLKQTEEERDVLLKEHEELQSHRRTRSLFYQEEIEKMKDFMAAMEQEKEKALEEERQKSQEEQKLQPKHKRSRSTFYKEEIVKLQEEMEQVEKEKENAVKDLQSMWIAMNTSDDIPPDLAQTGGFTSEQLKILQEETEELRKQLDEAEREKEKALEEEREISRRTLEDVQKEKKHRRGRSQYYQGEIEKLKESMADLEAEREVKHQGDVDKDALNIEIDKRTESETAAVAEHEAKRQESVEKETLKREVEQLKNQMAQMEIEKQKALVQERAEEVPIDGPIKKHRRNKSQFYQDEITKLKNNVDELEQQKTHAVQRLEKLGDRVEDTLVSDTTAATGEFLNPEDFKFSAKQLIAGVDGVHSKQKEQYLTDYEFQEVFTMDKSKFYKLAAWKQVQLKKTVGMF